MRRFEVDHTGEVHAARLRMTAAIIAVTSAIWLLCVSDAWVPRIAAVLGLGFGALWIRALRVQRRAPSCAPDCVDLGEHHLAVCQRGVVRSIPLQSVQSVALDHDRLAVVITLEGPGDIITLDAPYRGIGLDSLAEQLHAAVQAARQGALRENTATMADHERA